MYANLTQTLTTFLKIPVTLIFRGDAFPIPVANQLPVAWSVIMGVERPLEESIVAYWALGEDPRPFVERLVHGCRTVALVLDQDKVVGLLYILELMQHGRTVETAWLGGVPATASDIALTEAALHQRLSSPYRDFVKIHNGFWLYGWNTCGIYSLHKVGLLQHIVPTHIPGSAKPSDIDPSKLLCFSGDGSGTEGCLAAGVDDSPVFVWDHESYTISPPIPFWDYISRLLVWVG